MDDDEDFDNHYDEDFDYDEDDDDFDYDGPDYEDDEDYKVPEVGEVYGILTDEEKAVVTKNLLAAAVEMGDNVRGVCKYGFSDREGTFNLAHDACVSQLSYPLGGYGGAQHKVGGIINWAYKGVPDELIQYVSDPEFSPWRALIQKGFTLYSTPSGKTHAFIMTDLEHPGPHFGSFMKVFRTYSEKPACGALATALIKRGVHPGLVLFLTQSFYTMDEKNVSQVNPGLYSWHGSFLFNHRGLGLKALKNFITGVHKYDAYGNKQVWRINHNYSGCDSIFIEDPDEPSYAEYLKAKYSDLLVKKTVKGAFSTVEVGGWTIDTLTDICFKEMAEHGFNYDYNQDQ